jgi:hypothetical protein
MTVNSKRLSASQWMCGILLACSTMGCSAVGMVQTAQTLGKGGWEVSIDPGVNGLIQYPTPGPVLHGAFRYGVTDSIDIGGRVGTTFLEFQSKFLLTAPENPVVAVSIAPAVGVLFAFAALGGVPTLNASVPLLVGFKLGPHELTLGPRLQNTFFFGETEADASAYILNAGGSLGFAAQVTEKFRILPEISFATPLVIGAIGGETGDEAIPFNFGLVFYSFNLGFQFGSPRKKFATKAGEQQ